MKTVKVEKLKKETFAPFGEFYSFENPDGLALSGELHKFFPDRLLARENCNLAFSPIIVKKPQVMKITQVEYHTTTCEIIMPLNDDMIVHVAPPSAGKPVPEYIKAFLVPKHTMIKMNANVMHLAPLPAKKDELKALIVLPECTYMNDCTVIDLKENECFVIEK